MTMQWSTIEKEPASYEPQVTQRMFLLELGSEIAGGKVFFAFVFFVGGILFKLFWFMS